MSYDENLSINQNLQNNGFCARKIGGSNIYREIFQISSGAVIGQMHSYQAANFCRRLVGLPSEFADGLGKLPSNVEQALMELEFA